MSGNKYKPTYEKSPPKSKTAHENLHHHRENLILLGPVRREHHSHCFSLGREKEWHVHPTLQPKGLTSDSPNSEGWLKQRSLGTWGLWTTKERQGLMPHLKTCSTTDRHQREQRVTSSWKRSQQTSLPGKLHAHSQKKMHLQKKFEGLTDPLPELTDKKSSPV